MKKLEVINELKEINYNIERTITNPEDWDYLEIGWNRCAGFCTFEINNLIERI